MNAVRRASFTVAVAVALALAGCGGTDNSGVPTQLVYLDGSGQVASPGAHLPNPIRVRVLTAQMEPVANIAVSWRIVDGNGQFVAATTKSDDTGIAATQWVLGQSIGQQTAQAYLNGTQIPAVTFSATAGNPNSD